MPHQLKIKVKRQDPEAGSQPRWQTYDVELPEGSVVLDALLKIREDIDGTLTFRCSCRAAICGSCSMRINGQATLACKLQVAKAIEKTGTNEITFEPMGNLPVMKDLVVDMTPFWTKVKAVEPWMQVGPIEPEREYLVSNEDMLHQAEMMNCVMCGACVSDCTVLAVDANFLGPAALAKAYRFVADPRDANTQTRLEHLSDYGGVWDCTHCFMCVEVCPKGVAPMERIMATRELAMAAGVHNNNGYRHIESLANSVKESGWLDEAKLAIDSFGMFNLSAQLAMLPFAIRSFFKGKAPLPGPLHHKRPGAENVKRIFRKLEVHH
ncbi:MAG: succinate dehydrogenase iron-sulfur subunit [Chloroflexi bacterium]|nr:succinate dehydrogenase iron-sulfur subunit [Chloroflexota bacterium]